ncbi:unnamed protein product, partial [Durusdinium trenchii]
HEENDIPEVTGSSWHRGFESERSMNVSTASWSSSVPRPLRGLWGPMELPPLPPSMEQVYGRRDLPLGLKELNLQLQLDMEDDLARTLSPRSAERLCQSGSDFHQTTQTSFCSLRRKNTAKSLPKTSTKSAAKHERLLPIAPRANKTFFDRKAKMCVRVVRFQNTKVKLRISGSKGSVVAEPLRPSCPRCHRSLERGGCHCHQVLNVIQVEKDEERPAELSATGSASPDSFEPPQLQRRCDEAAEPSPPGRSGRLRSPGDFRLARSTSWRDLARTNSDANLMPRPSGSGQMDGNKICLSCGYVFLSETVETCRNCGQKRQTLAEMRKEMILNAKEDVRVSVFNKLQDHNEIHRDELSKGLELCGFVGIREAWVETACDAITKYSTLELEEFLSVVRGYEAIQDKFYKSTFEEADLDNSGTMEAVELAEMLENLGIEPMSHVLVELIHEVDEDGKGALKFPEFKHLMDLLMVREGFTSSEYETYMELFQRLSAASWTWVR